jgi:hypothetical protein
MAADRLDQRQLLTLEQAAVGDRGIEARLEVLEGERVVEDADVALAETCVGKSVAGAGHIGRGIGTRGRVIVVVAAGRQEGARRTGSARQHKELAPRVRILGRTRDGVATGLRGYGHVFLTSIRGVANTGVPP